MPAKQLTEASVKNAKPRRAKGAAVQTDFWDTRVPCFGLRVGASGAKTWVVLARIYDFENDCWGAPRRISIGRYPDMSLKDARGKACVALDAARAKKNPRDADRIAHKQTVEARRNTFDAMAGRFLTEYCAGQKKLRPKSVEGYRTVLCGQATEAFRGRPITEITKQDVRAAIAAIMDAGKPVAANRALTLLKRFFDWCAETIDLSPVPTANIKRPSEETPRERLLSDDELRDIWLAAEQQGYPYGSLFRWLLITGARRTEGAGMAWSEVGLDAKDTGGENGWLIPKTRLKNGNRRNSAPHYVPLPRQAVRLLQSMPRFVGTDLVFPSEAGTSVSGFSKAKSALEAAIAEMREARGDEPMAPWHVHDFRRAMSTWMHERGDVQPHIVEAVLNHVSGHKAGVAGIYNVAAYTGPKRDALQKWADHLERLCARAELAAVA